MNGSTQAWRHNLALTSPTSRYWHLLKLTRATWKFNKLLCISDTSLITHTKSLKRQFIKPMASAPGYVTWRYLGNEVCKRSLVKRKPDIINQGSNNRDRIFVNCRHIRWNMWKLWHFSGNFLITPRTNHLILWLGLVAADAGVTVLLVCRKVGKRPCGGIP